MNDEDWGVGVLVLLERGGCYPPVPRLGKWIHFSHDLSLIYRHFSVFD